jgi:hypothetical protein
LSSGSGGLGLCAGAPCSNGGTCINGVDDGFTCACEVGYSGATCATSPALLSVVQRLVGVASLSVQQQGDFRQAVADTLNVLLAQVVISSVTPEPVGTVAVPATFHGLADVFKGVAAMPAATASLAGTPSSAVYVSFVVAFADEASATTANSTMSAAVQDGSFVSTLQSTSTAFSGVVVLQISSEVVVSGTLCDSFPCGNGGTCTNNVNSYSCSCLVGYSGSTCGTSKSTVFPCVVLLRRTTAANLLLLMWYLQISMTV